MSKAKQILVKEEVNELKKLLANRSVTISNPAEKMWARFKRAFSNKLFHSMEEISLFIDNAVNEITHDIVIPK